MKNTNRKGDIAELAVAKRFLELGYWVSFPFGDDAPYDLIIDNMVGEFIRVQVKHLKPDKRKTLLFRLHSDAGIPYKKTTDLMAAYNPENGQIYVINPKDFTSKSYVSLRLEKPKNNQTNGIHLAENYLLK